MLGNMDVLQTAPPLSRDARAYEKLKEAEAWRLKNFGMEGYIPNPAQYRAHMCEAKTILYSGGNRAGKSTLGAIELCWALTKQYPAWFPKSRRLKGLVKAVVSGTEFPIIGRVIEPKIFSLLPKSYFRYKRTPQGYLNKITCVDGSTVDILTLEMKDEAYESADWDFAWLDEPQSHIKYQAIRRGLVDRGGLVIFTFTPLTEPWMHEELISKADGKRIAVFQVNTRDNMYDIKGNVILKEENIQEFEDALPEDVRETRLSGVFFHMKGRIYMEFCDAHVIDVKYEYPDPVICVLDPHDRQPHHVIWAFVDRNDDVFVDYEMTIHCELPDLARHILRVEKERGYNMRKRIIDPNFGRKPAAAGTQVSVMTELSQHHCRFMEGDDDKETGHMLVREWLHFDLKKPVTAVNKPKLFFDKSRCPKTVKSMRNLQFEDWQGKTKSDKNPKEVEKEKENHGADCVRYLIITKPRHDRLERKSEELGEPTY